MGIFTVGNAIEQLNVYLYYSIIRTMQDFMKYMGNMGGELFDDSYIQGLIFFFKLLGQSLFLIGLIIAWFDYVISCESGRISVKNTLLNNLKGMAAVTLFTDVPVLLFRFSVQIEVHMGNIMGGLHFSEDYQKAGNKSALDLCIDAFSNLVQVNPILNVAGSITSVLPGSSSEQHVPTIVNLLFIVAFAYCFIKVLFGNLKRGTILLIQICVGSLFMLSIPRGFMDGFLNWCKQILGTCLMVFFQNILLIVGLQAFRGNMTMGLGLMLGAAEVPVLVKLLFGGYDNSVRANMSSAVHTASSALSFFRVFVPA